MARYVMTAEKFRCGDESGLDFLGSDEPFWVFTGKDSSGNVNTHRSKTFGNVDSGDTRDFDSANGANVIWPKKGATRGDTGPIAVTVQVWERDQGNPDTVAQRTEQAFELAGQHPTHGEWVRRIPPIVKNQLVRLLADDLMGSATLLFEERALARRLRAVGHSFVQKIHLGGRSGDLPFEVAGGPDYDLFLRVTRLA
jgi:hypothetical protein